jgi:hypothetical protein
MKINALLIAIIFFASDVLSQVVGKIEPANDKLNSFFNERDFCISDDNGEAYFTIQSPFQEVSQIAFMKKKAGIWSEPQLVSFSGKYSDMEPFLSPDQTRLYFASNRPLPNAADTAKDYDIWYVERKNSHTTWSAPVNMGSPVNSENSEFYPSVSLNNNLFFTSETSKGLGKDDIFFCKWTGDSYATPVLLDTNINSSGYEFNAFVSRKEDILIYTKYNSADGLGSGDLYISIKDDKGNWTKAKNFGEPINTKFMEYCPFYDEKNGIMYFTSKRNSIKPKKFNDLSDLNKTITNSENGLSKIYKVHIKPKNQ